MITEMLFGKSQQIYLSATYCTVKN